MLLIGSILLLLANAVPYRRENLILSGSHLNITRFWNSRYDSLAIGYLDTRIGVWVGLFHFSAIYRSFLLRVFLFNIISVLNNRTLVKWLGLTELVLPIIDWLVTLCSVRNHIFSKCDLCLSTFSFLHFSQRTIDLDIWIFYILC